MTKKTYFIIILMVMGMLWQQAAKAQLNAVGSMINASQDAGKLFTAYLKPYANAFGSDLNAAWYNTAKPHKLLGFDLTLTMNFAFVPSSDKSYNVNNIGLTSEPVVGNSMAPTVAGSKSEGPRLSFTETIGGKKYEYAGFHTPQGSGIGVIPAPMMQFGIGIPLGSEIMFRFIPNTSLGDNGNIQLLGFGLKHSIKQWIPGISMAPFFHLSVVGGYTQLKTKVNMNYQPSDLASDLSSGGTSVTNQSIKTYDNQNMQVIVKGFTGDLVGSFDLPIITFYAGLGFCTTNTSLKVNGDFPKAEFDAATQKIVVKDAVISNPLNTTIKSTSGSSTKPRLNGGLKFKLGFLTIHFDYTKANYSVVTAGLGVSIR